MYLMAELGYTLIQVYDLTLHQVITLRNAVMMRNSRQWEMHRLTAYLIAASNPGRKGKMPAIHNFLPLLSDTDRYAEDIDERNSRHALMSSMYKQYNERWKN